MTMTHEETREVEDALRRVDGVLGLAEPAGEAWRELVPGESAATTVPLVDLFSPLPHASRVELAQRVLGSVAAAGVLAVVERADARSMAPDIPIVASMPRLGARLRAGRRDAARLAELTLRGDHPFRAHPLLRALGREAAPLAEAVRSSKGPLRERSGLIFEITRDPDVGRELLAEDPESARDPDVAEVAIADATSDDERRRRVALDALGPAEADPVWLAFLAAVDPRP